jgi:hypothetical protein
MATSTYDEILVGAMATRLRIEPAESDGVIAIHEFDLRAGATLPVPLSHDAFEETNRGGLGQRRCLWQRASGGQLRCVWV